MKLKPYLPLLAVLAFTLYAIPPAVRHAQQMQAEYEVGK